MIPVYFCSERISNMNVFIPCDCNFGRFLIFIYHAYACEDLILVCVCDLGHYSLDCEASAARLSVNSPE